MDDHSRIEMAHMLYGVCLAIIHGERGLSEPPGEFRSLNSSRKRRPRDLIQRLAHSIVSHAFSRGACVPTFVVVLLFIGERLIRWGLWPSSIATIPFTVRGGVRARGSSPSLCMAQLSLQLVDFQLQCFGILFLREMTLSLWLASSDPGTMHTLLSIPSPLEVDERILALGSYGFYLSWIWICHGWTLSSPTLEYSLSHRRRQLWGPNLNF